MYHKKIKFEDYKNCLEATQLKNKITHLEKNEIDVNSLTKNLKEFIKTNKLILKTQQIFKSERCVLIEKINKIALSSNDGKRIQSIDLLEAYVYGTSKDLVNGKGEIKSNNIIKEYKK